MKKQNISATRSTVLRQQAEKRLKKKAITTSPLLSEAEALKLIHELQVYQVELEMQNTELERAKTQITQDAARKYTELYDFAPAGYFTLSREGKIKKINISGAAMLCKEQNRIRDKSFSSYFSE